MIDDNPQAQSRKAYWLERWERNETGFHQTEINPYLLEFWQELQLSRDSTVFVPGGWRVKVDGYRNLVLERS